MLHWQLDQVRATLHTVETNTERFYNAAKRRIEDCDARIRVLRTPKAAETAVSNPAQEWKIEL